MVTKETKDILLGKYGATVKPFNPEVQKKCIGDEKPITCRPADLLDNELEKLESEMAQYKEQDEDVLTRTVPTGSYGLLQIPSGSENKS